MEQVGVILDKFEEFRYWAKKYLDYLTHRNFFIKDGVEYTYIRRYIDIRGKRFDRIILGDYFTYSSWKEEITAILNLALTYNPNCLIDNFGIFKPLPEINIPRKEVLFLGRDFEYFKEYKIKKDNLNIMEPGVALYFDYISDVKPIYTFLYLNYTEVILLDKISLDFVKITLISSPVLEKLIDSNGEIPSEEFMGIFT